MDGRSNAALEVVEPDSLEHAHFESRIRKTLGNQPPNAEKQLALAELLFDKGDDAEVVRMLRQIVYTDPSCQRAYDRLVDTYIRLGRRVEAAETYREWGQRLSRRSTAAEHTEPVEAVNSSVADDIAHYYAIRAPEYDETSSYQRPEGSEFVNIVKAEIRAVVQDRDAIEIACGTGYWTAVAAEAARTLLATDRNVELVEIVRKKMASSPNVKCQVADAYSLEGIPGKFTAAYAQFWWSHIPRSMIRTFLTALHSKLAANARVFFMDSMPYVTRGTRRLDDEGNVIEPRILMNGEKYEVIKNFPTESDLREALEGFADDLQYQAYDKASLWTVSYRARAQGEVS